MGKSPEGGSGAGRGLRFWSLTLATGAVVALLGTWIVAAMTVRPTITLSAASTLLENFHRDAADPAKVRDAWNTMTTTNYRRYVGITYPKFREFWQNETPPDIVHVSKDGDQTFSVLLVYHPKGGGNLQNQFAAVLVCDDWRARWTFGDCGAESLRLDDIKHYDYRVVQG
ncbi:MULTISPECIES: hypothetical protein [Pseudofrankia]|uniref:hypothetical protein n=1 Tax=Pseudofrankia TaxID=2994363 RepID=UPI000234CB82|nr:MULTISPECIES: hypothetical protein [Pseudofrankia]